MGTRIGIVDYVLGKVDQSAIELIGSDRHQIIRHILDQLEPLFSKMPVFKLLAKERTELLPEEHRHAKFFEGSTTGYLKEKTSSILIRQDGCIFNAEYVYKNAELIQCHIKAIQRWDDTVDFEMTLSALRELVRNNASTVLRWANTAEKLRSDIDGIFLRLNLL